MGHKLIRKRITIYSHSIVAGMRLICLCDIVYHLIRLVLTNPNHFVITPVITNRRKSGGKLLPGDYSQSHEREQQQVVYKRQRTA